MDLKQTGIMEEDEEGRHVIEIRENSYFLFALSWPKNGKILYTQNSWGVAKRLSLKCFRRLKYYVKAKSFAIIVQKSKMVKTTNKRGISFSDN